MQDINTQVSKGPLKKIKSAFYHFLMVITKIMSAQKTFSEEMLHFWPVVTSDILLKCMRQDPHINKADDNFKNFRGKA